MSYPEKQLYIRFVTAPIPEVILDQVEECTSWEVEMGSDRGEPNILVFILPQEVLRNMLRTARRRFEQRKRELITLGRRYTDVRRDIFPIKLHD